VNGEGAAGVPGDVFRSLAAVLRDRCGLEFGDGNRYLLESRVLARIRELRLEGPRAYVQHLRYGPGAPAELDTLIDRVTNPETYFFREPEQLRAFTEEILPSWEERARAGAPLRIWSAGCASGEEPFTFAMLLEEMGYFGRRSVEILGSDISTASLARARQATFRENSLRETSPERRERFFDADGPGRFRLRDAVRGRVAFSRTNLADRAELSALPPFDVVFCRNVLIYLCPEAKRSVVAGIHSRLAPGGFLVLGRVESLVALSTEFRLRHLRNDMVYQK
jgi:chemotaxis protein methyltransferase CheR